MLPFDIQVVVMSDPLTETSAAHFDIGSDSIVKTKNPSASIHSEAVFV